MDCVSGMQSLPDQSVNMCVTSPPYFGLRDYGVDGQIGLEETPEQFIEKLVSVFREVKRVLRDDGTLWLNIGDSYNSGASGALSGSTLLGGQKNQENSNRAEGRKKQGHITGIKHKDLIGIPWMLAFALRADGWYLRQDIIWHKPNPMPESVTDRCTKSHEYIFLLSKSPKYYYDNVAIMQDVKLSSIQRLSQDIEGQQGSYRVPGKTNGAMKAKASWKGSSFEKGKTGEMMATHGHTRKSGNIERKPPEERGCPEGNNKNQSGNVPWEGAKANKRSVWTVSTKPFKEAHFATFPEELIVDCIKAGCPEGGTVLDPFGGAGTTAVVSRKMNRNYILFELNPQYIEIANRRLHSEIGLFNHEQ